MKTLLLLSLIVGAFAAGAVAEERLEWRTCRALSFFDATPSPALYRYHVPPGPPRRKPTELAAK